MSRSNKPIPLLLLLVSSLAWSDPSQLTWQGFLSLGFANAQNNNFLASKDGDSNALYNGGLSTRWDFSPKLSAAGQLIYRDIGKQYAKGLNIDYLKIDYKNNFWSNSEQTLSAGRFKSQIGLYNSTRDIPFTHPDIFLPQSIYATSLRDFMLRMDGVNLHSAFYLPTGTFTTEIGVGKNPLDNQFGDNIVGPATQGDWRSNINYYLNLRYQQGAWTFAANHTHSTVHYSPSIAGIRPGKIESNQFVFSLQYQQRDWEFTSEYGERNMDISGFDVLYPVISWQPNPFAYSRTQQSGYGQLRFFLSDQWTLMVRYDLHYNDKNDKKGSRYTRLGIPDYFAWTKDATLGISWHPNDQWLVRLEQHWIDGTSWLPALGYPDTVHNLHRNWQLFALQVSYRF